MATLATIYNRWIAAKNLSQAEAARAAASNEECRLRALANEDVYLFVKKIDNSRVIREADPRAREACWKAAATAGIVALLVIGVLLPSAYGLFAGYQIQALRQEGQRLENERAALELEETRLVTPSRIQQLAEQQKFVDPSPQKVIYLDPAESGSLALNK